MNEAAEKTLTKEALLAMPESDYMNELQQAFFKNLLLSMKLSLSDTLAGTKHSIGVPLQFADDVDRASYETMQEADYSRNSQAKRDLKAIDKALFRIENGTYGWCEETGEPIGLARLLVLPTASLSLAAQERMERAKALYTSK